MCIDVTTEPRKEGASRSHPAPVAPDWSMGLDEDGNVVMTGFNRTHKARKRIKSGTRGDIGLALVLAPAALLLSWYFAPQIVSLLAAFLDN